MGNMTMTGTEKQTTWATDLIAEYRDALTAYDATTEAEWDELISLSVFDRPAWMRIQSAYGIRRDDIPLWLSWLGSLTDAAQVIDLLSPKTRSGRHLKVRMALKRHAAENDFAPLQGRSL